MKSKKDYNYLHYAIAILIFLAIRFLVPLTNGLNLKGLNVLAIFISTVYMWLMVGVEWTCLLSIGAVALTGSLSWIEISSYSFGNFVVPLLIGINILNYALDKTGVAKRIARWFMTRKIIENKPWMLISMFLFSMYILGLFLETFSLMLIYINLAKALFENLGYEKGEKLRKAVMLGILWIASLTFAASPISHAVPIIALGLLAAKGIIVSYIQYMIIGVPFSFAAFILGLLMLRFVINPDVSKVEKYDIECFKKSKTPITKQEIWASTLFILVTLSWLAPSILTFAPKIAATINAWGFFAAPFIAVCLLFAIKIDGAPVLEFNDAMKHIMWPIAILTATIQMYSTLMGLSSLGINIWLADILRPLLTTLPITGILLTALLGAMLMTNFTSNTVTLVIFFTICAPIIAATASSPLSIAGFLVLLSLAVNSAFLTPAATPMVPFALSFGDLTTGDNFKYSSLMFISCAISIVLVGFPIAKIVL